MTGGSHGSTTMSLTPTTINPLCGINSSETKLRLQTANKQHSMACHARAKARLCILATVYRHGLIRPAHGFKLHAHVHAGMIQRYGHRIQPTTHLYPNIMAHKNCISC